MKFNQTIHDRILNSFLFEKMNSFFQKIAFEGHGSNKCLEKGYLPVPVTFHSPIPDILDLKKRRVWSKKTALCGINFNIKKQLVLLKQLGKKYNRECRWPLEAADDKTQFYVNNCSFSFGCAAALHTIVREFKPRRIIEIGSGNSSLVIAAALKLSQQKCQYDIIDPYPGEVIRQKKIKYSRLFPKRVELTKLDFFENLKENDILFIDSSHSVKIGGDVNFLYLEVLPRLKPGILIHLHDIHLPYEYHQVYATSEVFRQFWTEQYLLQAFLINNQEFEILLAMNYLMKDRRNEFRRAFPSYDPQKHKFTSSSFWLKRK